MRENLGQGGNMKKVWQSVIFFVMGIIWGVISLPYRPGWIFVVSIAIALIVGILAFHWFYED
jgi:hypothetical protein